jgi:CheY-like chemotaxis protein
VLLVDDSPSIRALYATYLESAGAVCDQAGSGDEALAKLAGSHYDALVVDLAMPGIGGIELTQRLRRENRQPPLRILGVSAHADPSHRASALAAGMDAFLVKPAPLAELAAALGAGGPAPDRPDPADQVRWKEGLEHELTELEQAIADSIARGDWPAVRLQAHQLQGVAAFLPDTALQTAAAAIVSAAEQDDRETVTRRWIACQAQLAARRL